MNIKEKFENHYVVFGLTLIVIGFASGFGADAVLNKTSEHEQTPNAHAINCRIEGLDEVDKRHNDRVANLYSQVVELEKNASDHTLIGSYQEKYQQAAQRIRQDIETESVNYLNVIQSLKKQCE